MSNEMVKLDSYTWIDPEKVIGLQNSGGDSTTKIFLEGGAAMNVRLSMEKIMELIGITVMDPEEWVMPDEEIREKKR